MDGNLKVSFYLKRERKNKKTNGNDSTVYPIVGKIIIGKSIAQFSSKLKVEERLWNVKFGRATGKSRAATQLNREINKVNLLIHSRYSEILKRTGSVTALEVKNAFQCIASTQKTLLVLFEEFMQEFHLRVGIDRVKGSYYQYVSAYRHLKNFLKNKLGVDDIPFGKVNIALIIDYVYYLKVDLLMATRSVNSFLAPFRTVVKRAFNKGQLRQDPFFDYTHEKEIIKRRYLSGEELEQLMKTDFKGASANYIRDMFLFATFTGLSYSDLKNLQHNHLHQQANGSMWIVLKRKKTGVASHIPLLDIPLQIIEKYKNTKFAGGNGYVFKVQTKENLNLQLKQIAKTAGIDKRLTFHMSRHTFATSVCLTNGVPIESLSQMMGHLSIKTTQIYAHVTRIKLNEDMTNLEKRIEGQYKLADNEVVQK